MAVTAIAPPAVSVVARNVGVRYDLRLTRDRTVRRTLADLASRRRGDRDRSFWALRNVSFDAQSGDILGVIGANGAGKSTLLLCVAGILVPNTGVIRTVGRVTTLLTLGAGFDRHLTGRENIYLNGAFLGLPRDYVDDHVGEIVEFAELGDFIDVPIRKYSSGMRARLGFSIAAHVDPDIVLLDEVLGVGDAAFKQKSRAKLEELIDRAKVIIVVTHDTSFVAQTCTRALWLENGSVGAFGEPQEVTAAYLARAHGSEGPVRSLGRKNA